LGLLFSGESLLPLVGCHPLVLLLYLIAFQVLLDLIQVEVKLDANLSHLLCLEDRDVLLAEGYLLRDHIVLLLSQLLLLVLFFLIVFRHIL
jgi:hypothetical protein